VIPRVETFAELADRIRALRPRGDTRADLVVDGAATFPHDPTTEYVVRDV
jgi:hypothetical protein